MCYEYSANGAIHLAVDEKILPETVDEEVIEVMNGWCVIL